MMASGTIYVKGNVLETINCKYECEDFTDKEGIYTLRLCESKIAYYITGYSKIWFAGDAPIINVKMNNCVFVKQFGSLMEELSKFDYLEVDFERY